MHRSKLPLMVWFWADTYLNEFVFRYNRRFYRHVFSKAYSGSPRTITPRVTGKRTQPHFGFDPAALDIDQPGTTG